MHRYYFILIFLAISSLASAQTDYSAIRQRILEAPATKEDMIFKGRLLLVDRFEAMQFDSVRMIIDFFDAEIDDDTHQSLWSFERIMLYYWTKQYDLLISYVAKLENEPRYEYPPLNDRVGEMLAEWSTHDFDTLKEWIDESGRSDEDISFLKMLLESLMARSPHLGITQKKLNEQADMFLKKYPYSAYNDLVKKYVAYKTELSKWGYGYGLDAGYTFANHDYFNPRFAIAMDFKIHYMKTHLVFFMDVGFGKLKQDIPGTTWLKGEQANVISMGVTLGYSVFERNKLRFAPFAGFSYNYSIPEEKLKKEKPELKNMNIGGISPIVGLNVDWNVSNRQTFSYTMQTPKPFQTLTNINLKIAWIPQAFIRENNIYKGNLLFVTVGFSFDTFPVKK